MNYIVYSKPGCSYCDKAKALLTAKGLTYEERIIDVGQIKEDGKIYVTVQQLKNVVPSARTVPQILFGDELIGGFDSLQIRLK